MLCIFFIFNYLFINAMTTVLKHVPELITMLLASCLKANKYFECYQMELRNPPDKQKSKLHQLLLKHPFYQVYMKEYMNWQKN